MNYYVYVLLDTRKPGTYTYGRFTFDYEPFYIGKGSGNRKLQTARAIGNPLKRRIIDRIREDGLKPKGKYVRKDLTEEQAFALERKLIALIGRRYEKAGPLANLTAGGEGFTAPVREAEAKRKRNWRKAMDARTPEQKKATSDKLRAAYAALDPAKEAARRKKISDTARKKREANPKPPKVKRTREEINKAIAEAARRRWSDPDFRKKMAESPAVQAGAKAAGKALRGRTYSDEHRKRISDARTRYWQLRKAESA